MNAKQICVLLELWYLPFDDQHEHLDGSPAANRALDFLQRENMVKPNTSGMNPSFRERKRSYTVTARGVAMCKKLTDVELPVLEEIWV